MNSRHVRFLRTLAEEREPEELQRRILALFLEFQNVERGSIWVRRGGGYQCIEAAGSEAEKIRGMILGKDQASIVGWAVEHGEMTIAEAGRDQRHFSLVEKDMDVKSRLILCFPLTLAEGEIYGALQLIDTSAGGDRLNLDPAYLSMLQELADIGAIALKGALAFADQLRKNRLLKGVLDEIRFEETLIGASPVFQETLRQVVGYAATDYPVIIFGESGTGKDLLAREIHRRSRRASKPLLVQNCSAIPATLLESELFGYARGAFTGAVRNSMGLFESADRGTVFLDEIGEMEFGLQAKLLRVLENNEIKPLGGAASKKVDVRLISATNRDLEGAVRSGQFRQDLYYRLNVLPLRAPTLRERKEDVPLLARHFLKREAFHAGLGPLEFSPDALGLLTEYSWPGNVRELENLVKKLMVFVDGETIEARHLPESVRSGGSEGLAVQVPLSAPLAAPEVERADAAQPGWDGSRDIALLTWEEMERTYALKLLDRCRWNVSQAARVAGVNRSTFDSRMRRLGISKSG